MFVYIVYNLVMLLFFCFILITFMVNKRFSITQLELLYTALLDKRGANQ